MTTDDSSQEESMPTECAAELTTRGRPTALNLLVASQGSGARQIIDCQDYSSMRRLVSQLTF